MIKRGKKVRIEYALMVNGEVIDTTEGREPFHYVHGKQQILPALEHQLEGLNKGDKREIILGPEDAYGIIDQQAFVEIPKVDLPQTDIEVGMRLGIISPDGRQIPATVVEVRFETILLDLNHPLAGKELHFTITIIDVK